ncbi:MAG: hypothetical protein ACRD9Q_07765 [Nitrososphaeraceae archaeon]
MGEFIEPESIKDIQAPKIFTNEFITGVIKKSLDNGDLPIDHRLAIIGAVDENGVRAVISVKITNNENLNIKFQSIVEHEWTGDNKAGAQLLFSLK